MSDYLFEMVRQVREKHERKEETIPPQEFHLTEDQVAAVDDTATLSQET